MTTLATLIPVCTCGRRGRPVDPLSITGLPRGWSCAPYPAGFVHRDGSTGWRYTCPTCNAKRPRYAT